MHLALPQARLLGDRSDIRPTLALIVRVVAKREQCNQSSAVIRRVLPDRGHDANAHRLIGVRMNPLG